ncbi:MAG: hypothetical protein H0T53_11690 [Herpetosiphonaceae bacterium]|nr:hypothetical protein [Herpetosiphonaceae bacterium]
MTSTSQSRQQSLPVTVSAADYPAASRRFDMLVVLAGFWVIGGLYWDGWAHDQRLVDTFFTLWHAVLYSGFLAVATVIGGSQVRNMWRGHSLSRALPRGYRISLIGVIIFAFGGGFDLVWHSIFGFEADIDALISPAHLLLAFGAILFMSGPLRAAWMRARTTPQKGWADLLPAVLALFLVYLALSFFTQYTHPLGAPRLLVRTVGLERYFVALQIVTATLVFTALLMGVLLVGMRRFPLPAGSVTLLLFGGMLLMFLTRERSTQGFAVVLPVALGVGLLADLGMWRWRPSVERVLALRFFSFGLPFGFFIAYYVGILLTRGLVITEHLWIGTSIMAGVTGLFLSYLAAPPVVGE